MMFKIISVVVWNVLNFLQATSRDLAPADATLALYRAGIGRRTPGCQFPDSIQGLYKRQDDSKPPRYLDVASGQRYPIEYMEFYIGPSSIPHWGDCYESSGDSYILGVKKVGGFTCYRCFTLIQRSPNVLQAAVTEEAKDIKYQYCPVAGRARFSFAAGGQLQCHYHKQSKAGPSTINNCELGYQMDLSFRGCRFSDQDMNLKCLGTWNAGRDNGETYFALYNSEVEEYRCGLYKDDREKGGFAVAALSNDSTCDHLLKSSTDGFEQFVFYPEEKQPEWPVFSSECTFPKWFQGDWELVTVGPDIISYYHHNDPTTMVTQYAKCVAIQGDKIRLFSRNHCKDPLGYHCLWVKKRSRSVIEFKMGNVVLQHDDNLFCNDPIIYANSSWNTLAVRQPTAVVPCTHPGHFTTPLAMQKPGKYCFNVTTDCTTQYHMRIVGYLCNTDTIFDTRHYQCLASWVDNGQFFSYARLTEDGSKGCFASKIINGRLFMTWTGKTCERQLNFDQNLKENDSENNLFVLEQTDFCPSQIAKAPGTNDSGGFKPRPTKPIKPKFDQGLDRSFRKYPSNSGGSKRKRTFFEPIVKFTLFLYLFLIFLGFNS